MKDVIEAKIATLSPEDIPPDRLVDAIEKLMRAESFALGGPDHRIETTGDPIESMNVTQLKIYLETGKVPMKEMVGRKRMKAGQ